MAVKGLHLIFCCVWILMVSVVEAELSNDNAAFLCRQQQYNFISTYLELGNYGGEVLFSQEDVKNTRYHHTNSVVCKCDIRATQTDRLDKTFDLLIRWRNVTIDHHCSNSPEKCQDMFKVVLQSGSHGESSRSLIDNWSNVDLIRKQEQSASEIHLARLEYVHYTDSIHSLLSSKLEVIGNRRLYVNCGMTFGGEVDSHGSNDRSNSSIIGPYSTMTDGSHHNEYLKETLIAVGVICTLIILGSVIICLIWKRRPTVTYYGAHWRARDDDKLGTVGAGSMVVEVGTLDNQQANLPLTKPQVQDDFTVNFDPVAQSSCNDLTEEAEYDPSASQGACSALLRNNSARHDSHDSLLQVNDQLFIEAEMNSSWTDSPELPPKLPPRRGSQHNSSFPGVSPVLRPPPPSPRTKHYSWHYHSNVAQSNDSDSDDVYRKFLRRPIHGAPKYYRNVSTPEGSSQPLVHQSRRGGNTSSGQEVKLPKKLKKPNNNSSRQSPKQPLHADTRLGPVGAESGCECGNESDSSNSSLLSDRFPSSEHHVLDSDMDGDCVVKPSDSISNHHRERHTGHLSDEGEDEYLGIWQ